MIQSTIEVGKRVKEHVYLDNTSVDFTTYVLVGLQGWNHFLVALESSSDALQLPRDGVCFFPNELSSIECPYFPFSKVVSEMLHFCELFSVTIFVQ